MPKIARLEGGIIKDSRGEDTIEVTLTTKSGVSVRASVPAGKSVGKHEAHAVPAKEALGHIQEIVEPALVGRDVRDSAALDKTLCDLDGSDDKSVLGANTTLALSYCFYRAAAHLEHIPLWKYIRTAGAFDVEQRHAPKLLANLINGGVHAKNNLVFQEYLVVPRTREVAEAARVVREMLAMLGKVLEEKRYKLSQGDEGGYAPDMASALAPFDLLMEARERTGTDIDVGIDAAASDVQQNAWELEPLYDDMARRYPFIYLEDPFPEEDFASFARVKKRLGSKIAVVGDDLTVTNLERVARAEREGSVNGIIIKPNQVGTVTETLAVVRMAQKYGWKIFVSHRSGETDDDFIVDLGYGCGAEALKIGAPVQQERVAKYERLVMIARNEDI